MDPKLVENVRTAFRASGKTVTLGAPVHNGECLPLPLVTIPLAMLNRHGLIAGATGTGKTKTLQLMAEQLSAAGTPVFVADMKGDLSGLGAASAGGDRVLARSKEVGYGWQPQAVPIELVSLTGKRGAQLRATVSSFGPLLLAKVLGLNETQTSVLAMVFKYCDDKQLLLLDFADLRAVLMHLTGAAGAGELKAYGGLSRSSVGVLLREMVELEAQGALAFFGEPELDLEDLLAVRNGRGLCTVLELADVQDKPALFSTFMMWMLARLYATLPEVGDLAQPKLVFFFDEAHLLFSGASKAFLEQVQQVVRLVRSKGVGVFFVTQSPKDVPAEVLSQLGHRVQHALRAFTPDDEKALRAAARTFPRTGFYDVEETLTSLGIGEGFVTVLNENGTPTPPFATRLIPPASRMGPLNEAEILPFLVTQQVRKYATPIDRESAYEQLRERVASTVERERERERDATPTTRPKRKEESTFQSILKAPLTRSVASTITRSLMGALLGPPRRRRHAY